MVWPIVYPMDSLNIPWRNPWTTTVYYHGVMVIHAVSHGILHGLCHVLSMSWASLWDTPYVCGCPHGLAPPGKRCGRHRGSIGMYQLVHGPHHGGGSRTIYMAYPMDKRDPWYPWRVLWYPWPSSHGPPHGHGVHHGSYGLVHGLVYPMG